jgi:hypothetical protein
MRRRNATEVNMATLTHRTEMQLAREELLALDDIRGTRLRCLEGSIWLTLARDPRDIVLEPGDSFVVDRDGVTLLHALAPTRLWVETAREASSLSSSRWRRALAALRRRLRAAVSPVPAAA